MNRLLVLLAWAAVAAVCLSVVVPPRAMAARSDEAVIGAPQSPALIAERRYAAHKKGLQWLGMANKGEWSNPDKVTAYDVPELEYRGGTGTVFLFSGGVWVGAIKNGQKIVSTATDGDNGTGEFGALDYATPADQETDVRSVGWLEKTKDEVTDTQVRDAFRAGRYLGKGVKEKDDDGDWTAEDDVNANGSLSADFDGVPGVDDDGDGRIDEEILNGVDDDGDGLRDEDVGSLDEAWVMANASTLGYLNDDWTRVAPGDANGDGVLDYDPEPRIDEDSAGDMSNDYLDNDHDGLFDMDDPDHDGDLVVGSRDDDGDGLEDEDDLARAGQEFILAFADTCETCLDSGDEGFTPLGVRVVQHSYQWSETYADDFLLMDFEITNIGNSTLEGVCVGTFFDFDIGHLTQESSARSEDDITYYIDNLQLAIGGDNDGDDGLLDAQYFGVRVVQTPLATVQATYRNFNRLTGGDPKGNDAKYDLMASGQRDPDAMTAGDWRFVLAFGPLGTLPPGQTLPVTVAIVNGFDTDKILVNARQAKAMFDVDFRGPSSPDPPAFVTEVENRRVRILWKNNAESSVDPISQYRDFQGYNIWRSLDTQNWTLVKTWDYADSLGLNMGWPPPACTDPAYSAYSYEYVDSDIPNMRAWYTVTAFDDGNNGDGINNPQWDERHSGIGVLESPKVANSKTMVYPSPAIATGGDLSGVFVVPNPYVGSSRLEQVPWFDQTGVRQYNKDIEFRGLPAECDIEIYTLAGDLVQTLHHRVPVDVSGNPGQPVSWYAWNLRTRRNQEITAGIYIYRVSTLDGKEETIGKFVVVK